MASRDVRALRQMQREWAEDDAARASDRAAMDRDRTGSPAVCPTCGAVLVLGTCPAGHGYQQIGPAGLAWIAQ